MSIEAAILTIFLQQESLLFEVEATAIKRVIAFQILQARRGFVGRLLNPPGNPRHIDDSGTMSQIRAKNEDE